MKYRILGKTGYKISEVGFGGWAIGADWGNVSEQQAMEALNVAVDEGVNFIDTADVYGDGRSEKLIGKLLKQRKERIYVATKAGRRLSPHEAEGYNKVNLNKFVDRSRKNLGMDCLDLLQLHCPPTTVFYDQRVFEVLDEMVSKGKIRKFGVSVEKVEEGLKAIEYDGVSTVQIIFNMFRQRPAELFFEQVKKKNIGVIVRVPLASGLLTGKMTTATKFPSNDHRNYNRKGQAFDRGETFAGVEYKSGLAVVDELKRIVPKQMSMPQFALKWILMQREVSVVIPGSKRAEQVRDNTKVSELPNLSGMVMNKVARIYNNQIKKQVHQRW